MYGKVIDARDARPIITITEVARLPTEDEFRTVKSLDASNKTGDAASKPWSIARKDRWDETLKEVHDAERRAEAVRREAHKTALFAASKNKAMPAAMPIADTASEVNPEDAARAAAWKLLYRNTWAAARDAALAEANKALMEDKQSGDASDKTDADSKED